MFLAVADPDLEIRVWGWGVGGGVTVIQTLR